jgi:polyisoprenoid-binding protein YceI
MAGHNLLFHVTSWEATLVVGDAPSVELTADGASLRVIEGSGGLQSLGDGDKLDIEKTLDDDVLKRESVSFRSTSVQPTADGSGLAVTGDLTLRGTTRPLTFAVAADGNGGLRAVAAIKQTDWKMKPYSALYGALKVADEVEVAIDATLPAP